MPSNGPIPIMHRTSSVSHEATVLADPARWVPFAMPERRRERLTPSDRIRTSREFARVKGGGMPMRGTYCLALVLRTPGEATRVGWIASKRGVGGAVQRNRARRRLREILRRRWPQVAASGYAIVFVALRGLLTAPHEALARDVERVLVRAGAIRSNEEAC